MDNRLRIGVIGCGKVVQNTHLPAFAKSAKCTLAALCDASQAVVDGVADRYGVAKRFQRVEDILAEPTVDAVLIAVGDPLHVAITAQALEAGKHVLIEKPLGTYSQECLPLRDLVERSGLKLQVGVMKRHDPGIAFAREAIAAIGPILSFSIWYRASADALVDEGSVFLPVVRDPAYRRPEYKLDRKPYFIATHGSHLFDNVRFLFGNTDSVSAVLGIRGANHAWQGVLTQADGAVGNFDLSIYVESEWSEGVTVYGEQGSVHVTTPNPFFLRPSRVRTFSAKTLSWTEPVFADGDSYLRQLDAFAASVLEGLPVAAGIDDGIGALELIEAVEQSAELGGDKVMVGGR